MSIFLREDDISDGDISLTSTVGSDSQDDYDVEKILHECEDEDGNKFYLVKWEHYPLYRSTWEPRSNFGSNDPFIAWENRKRQIALGVVPAFDEAKFEKVVDKAKLAEARRKSKREEKRLREAYYGKKKKKKKKKRLISRKQLRRSSGSESEDELQTPHLTVPSSGKKRKRSTPDPPTASPTLSVNDILSSQFFLFNETPNRDDESDQTGAQAEQGSEKPSTPTGGVSKMTGTQIGGEDSGSTTTQPRGQNDDANEVQLQSGVKPKGNTAPAQSAAANENNAHPRNLATTASRLATVNQGLSTLSVSASTSAPKVSAISQAIPAKSATTDMPLKIQGKSKWTDANANLFAGWTADKKRRQKPFVSGETPKDSTEAHFRNLSMQHKFRRYAVNEPPPNPEALRIVSGDTEAFNDPRNIVSRTAPTPLRVDTTNVSKGPKAQSSSAAPATRSAASNPAGWPMYAKPTGDKQWIKNNVTYTECDYLHGRSKEYEDTGSCTNEGPELSGLRQDEAERISKKARLNGLTSSSSTKLPISRSNDRPAHVSLPQQQQQQQVRAPTVPLMRSPEELEDTAISPLNTDIMELAPSASPSEISARLEVGTVTSIAVQLLFDRGSNQSLFTDIGERPSLHTQHLCTASDFEQYVFQENSSSASGCVLSENDAESFESFVEHLVINTTGAIIQQKDFLMVCYPTTVQDWDFISNNGISKSTLRFYVQAPFPTSLRSPSNFTKPGESTIIDVCEKQLGLDQKRLFSGAGSDKNGQHKILDKAVFLVYPSRDSAEVYLLTAYLDKIGATIYHTDVPYAWSYFHIHHKSGVVIFHPSMSRYWEITFFYDTLYKGNFNIFQLGIDDTLLDHPQTTYSCVRLFAQSIATLITDDVFEHNPKQAKAVLELFLARTSPKQAGLKNDRIVTRPGLKDWLLDLIQEHPDDKTSIHYWVAIYVLVDQLMTPGEGDSGPSMAERDIPWIISPPLDELPGYEKMWDRDQETATDYLVEWFAGWSIFERERFRRFAVLHESARRAEQTPGFDKTGGKDPRGFSKRHQHILVTTPNRWLNNMAMKN